TPYLASRVGTRGRVGRLRGPRACPRPVGLLTSEHPEYHRNRSLPRDKHKAPSLPLRRPLSLQPRPSSSATRCIESLPSTPPLVPTPLQTIPKEPTCVSIPPFRLLSLRAINPILFVLTQSPAGNNI